MAGSESYARIYEAVLRIPRGRVATYGQIAALAGLPGHARQVGYALHRTPDELAVPWQRVLNAKGEIALRADPIAAKHQRELLRGEGVRFRRNGTVELRKYGWNVVAEEEPDE
ncbi:MAG: Methylated-DNA-[protein]-cysteine S-methyltransferase binding protein [Gemmatimonadetes bacterium]|nr:Methylated-DNA-[protein]-cysteine S-methyltransferase binding protein [Gemmatimonadota bacterium]